MGNNLSPLDIRSHALFLLDFVLWKWPTPSLVSKQMMKVTRLEEAKVKPNKCEAYTSDVTFPAWDTDTTCGIQPSPLLFKKLP